MLQITTDLQVVRRDLNSTKNNLQDVDAELQKSLRAQNTTLTARVSCNCLVNIDIRLFILCVCILKGMFDLNLAKD